MAAGYGRAEWQTDEAAATTDTLDLTDLLALTALPTEIARLPALRHLFAGDRRPDGNSTTYAGRHLSDITPLSGLPAHAPRDLTNAQVADFSVLLTIPAFAGERAEYLNFEDTPAADPERDRRMYMLSRLDGQRSAVETVQYLKGSHPDFRDPPGGAGRGGGPCENGWRQWRRWGWRSKTGDRL